MPSRWRTSSSGTRPSARRNCGTSCRSGSATRSSTSSATVSATSSIPAMEIPRLAALDGLELHPPEEFGYDELVRSGVSRDAALLEIAARACAALGVERAVVPATFPLEVADRLRAEGIELEPQHELFDLRRRAKTSAELAGIRRAQAAADAGMAAAAELLRAGGPVTSEAIKAAIDAEFMAHGCSCDEFIVSHGAQSAIGHHGGFGEIEPGEPVVIDIWPRDRESACFADMTRTFVDRRADRRARRVAPAREGGARPLARADPAGSAGPRGLRRGLRGVRGRRATRPSARRSPALRARPRLLPRARPRRRPRGARGAGNGARRQGRAPGRRRRHGRARPLPSRHRRLPARGPRRRDRRRLREPDPIPVRAASRDLDLQPAPGGAPLPAVTRVRGAGERAAGHLRARLRRVLDDRGAERVTWFEPFTKLYEWEPPYAKWYLGGKLNVCFNCVDRHVEAGRGDRVAYHWEGEPENDRRTISYADLQREVVRFANALRALGVRKGTPVAIYMGMVPELPVAMLACTRLGAPHTVVFGGFSADSLSDRMVDMGCEVLITQDEARRRGSARAAEEDRRRGRRGRAEGAHGGRARAHRRRRADAPRAATAPGPRSPRARATTPRPARASRWTPRTCSS